MKEIRLHGRGGQGVVLAAELLAVAAFLDGKWPQASPAFGGERRGAPVAAFVRLDQHPLRWRSREMDPHYLLVFDSTLFPVLPVLRGVRRGGLILVNAEGPVAVRSYPAGITIRAIPATRIALETTGQPRPNAPMLGAFAALTGEISLKALEQAFVERFPGKPGEANVQAARRAFQMAPAAPSLDPSISRDDETEPRGDEFWITPGLGGPGQPLHFAGIVGPRTSLAARTGDWRYSQPVVDPGRCNACGLCARFCPDSCLLPGEVAYEIDLTYCKGCGICAHECPRRAIAMVTEVRA